MMQVGKKDLFVDLGAEKLFAAEKGLNDGYLEPL